MAGMAEGVPDIWSMCLGLHTTYWQASSKQTESMLGCKTTRPSSRYTFHPFRLHVLNVAQLPNSTNHWEPNVQTLATVGASHIQSTVLSEPWPCLLRSPAPQDFEVKQACRPKPVCQWFLTEAAGSCCSQMFEDLRWDLRWSKCMALLDSLLSMEKARREARIRRRGRN